MPNWYRHSCLSQRSASSACRPLSKAQQAYAQRDAHYLLYLAHVLYLELQAGDAVSPANKDKSRVMQAWARCQKVSLSLYSKPGSQVTNLSHLHVMVCSSKLWLFIHDLSGRTIGSDATICDVTVMHMGLCTRGDGEGGEADVDRPIGQARS